MLFDDIAGGDITVAPTYMSFALILAAGAIPFKGWQTCLLNIAVIISTLISLVLIPRILGIGEAGLLPAQLIYLVMIAVLLTGLSSMLYNNRYEQYKVRRHAELLSNQLEERALILQKMKEKSELQADQLLENERLKNQFFANLSHEFRTPLTLILGPLKDVQNQAEEEKNAVISIDTIRAMQTNSERLLDYINQLLDLSKSDAGKISLKPQEIDPETFVSTLISEFASSAEKKQIRLFLTKKTELNPVYIDSKQFERVINNLLSNALKFTRTGGKVEVSLEKYASGTLVIQVTDNGIGIPSNELPFIFDRFYQASQTPNLFNEGTGIGLALAKDIVELHGGTIHVESKENEGSVFTVKLPAGSKTEALSLEENYIIQPENKLPEYFSGLNENESLPESSPHVVLIDDNPDILNYLAPHLSSRYHVHQFQQSKDAITFIKDQVVDLVISDVMMARPNGFEVCSFIKEHEKLNHIPVILLTAQTSEESRIEGLEKGADDYISKPFSASELMVRAENLIELRRMLRSRFSTEVHVKGTEIKVDSEEARFLEQVQQVIESHLEHSNFGVEWLAEQVHLSPRQLQRKISTITNLSAGGYIRMLRLERARQLLEQEWGNISEISYKVGFQDTKYFSKLFKQTFGVNPSEFSRNT
jgi:signal transduction histidine kinase/DNA-binding response OmpR family regulator